MIISQDVSLPLRPLFFLFKVIVSYTPLPLALSLLHVYNS